MADTKPNPPAAPAAPTKAAKRVRITVNFPGPVTVNSKRFEGGPSEYPDLNWKDEEWEKAKADGRLAIEEIDENGKVFVSRRNSEGRVVPEGTETIPPKPRKKAVAKAEE